MRAFDPTVSDYTKALSQGKSPRAIADARRRADDGYGRMQRFESILAQVRRADANALDDVTRWMPQVQFEPKPQTKPAPKQKQQPDAKLAALRAHFEGRRHR